MDLLFQFLFPSPGNKVFALDLELFKFVLVGFGQVFLQHGRRNFSGVHSQGEAEPFAVFRAGRGPGRIQHVVKTGPAHALGFRLQLVDRLEGELFQLIEGNDGGGVYLENCHRTRLAHETAAHLFSFSLRMGG